MLHLRQKNHVALANEFSAPGLRHQVDAFRGSAREDDFICTLCAEVICDTLPRFLVSIRRARAQV